MADADELAGIAKTFNELETEELVAKFKIGLTKEAAEIALRELATRGFNNDKLERLKEDAENAERNAFTPEAKKPSKLLRIIGWFLLMVAITSTIKFIARSMH